MLKFTTPDSVLDMPSKEKPAERYEIVTTSNNSKDNNKDDTKDYNEDDNEDHNEDHNQDHNKDHNKNDSKDDNKDDNTKATTQRRRHRDDNTKTTTQRRQQKRQRQRRQSESNHQSNNHSSKHNKDDHKDDNKDNQDKVNQTINQTTIQANTRVHTSNSSLELSNIAVITLAACKEDCWQTLVVCWLIATEAGAGFCSNGRSSSRSSSSLLQQGQAGLEVQNWSKVQVWEDVFHNLVVQSTMCLQATPHQSFQNFEAHRSAHASKKPRPPRETLSTATTVCSRNKQTANFSMKPHDAEEASSSMPQRQ